MSTSFPQLLSTEVGRMLSPLQELNSPGTIKVFLQDLGYSFDGALGGLDLSGLVGDVKTLTSRIDELADAETDEEKFRAALNLIEQSIAVVNKVREEIPKLRTALDAVSNLKGDDLLNFAEVFLRRLLDHLVYTYLEEYRAPVFAFLYLLKVADEVTDRRSGLDYAVLYWDKVPDIFSRPGALFDSAYNWSSAFQADEFLERFDALLSAWQIPGGLYIQSTSVAAHLGRGGESDPQEIRFPLYQTGVWGENWAEIDLNLSPVPADGPHKAGLLLYPYLYGGATVSAELSEDWTIELSGSADLGAGLGLEIRPDEKLKIKTDLFSAPLESVGMEATLTLRRNSEEEIVLIGSLEGGTFLSASKVEAAITALKRGDESDLGFEFSLGTMRFVVGAGKDGDGFIAKVMPDGFALEFDFGLGYSLERGLYFSGGSGLSVRLPANVNLGPLSIEGLTVGFTPGDRRLDLEMGADVKLDLGPFLARVENIGMAVEMAFPESGGQFGPVDFGFGFKPPSGIGLSIDAGAVKGAGYLWIELENGRYYGMAELTVQELVSLKAIAIINTQMPDGSRGFSMLLIITAEFTPIPLGFGFSLNGVGGLVGVHRTMLLDVMRTGMRTGALDSLLFPKDPVANANKIVSDLEAIFPIDEGRFVFGPMGKIGWGAPGTSSLVTLELGLLIEVPDPVRLAILGKLAVVLPDEAAPLLILQVAFLGTIDFEKKYLTFDATIYDSRVLTFTLEGDMILRLKWGDDPNFVFSVGGFHPQYTPPPLDIPDMKRLTLNLLTGNNPRLTLSAYFALTSNTVQVGARVELYIKVAKVFGKTLSVQGFLGFDALFQFSPFYFIVSVEAGFAVMYGGDAILSIYLGGSLEGPAPWKIRGKAEFKVLGIKFAAKVNKTFGKKDKSKLPDQEVTPLLVEALADERNWLPTLPEAHGGTVTLKESAVADGVILADPVSGIGVAQKVLPTEIELQKYGNYGIKDAKKTFSVTLHNASGTQLVSEPTYEQFAPAQYFKKKEAAKISGKSFEQMKAGVQGKAGTQLSASRFLERPVEYDETIYDGDSKRRLPVRKSITKAEFNARLLGNAVTRHPLGPRLGSVLGPDRVSLPTQTYAVSSRGDQSLYAGSATRSAIAAAVALRVMQAGEPELEVHLQVVPMYEVQQ
ncbi:MAG: DUF6603 domain-containing protein [Bacteroidota bacterium]